MRHIRRTTAALTLGALCAAVVAVPNSAQAVGDTTAPTISSVAAVSTTVLTGDPIALTFVGHDDVAVYSVVATFEDGAGRSVGVMSVGGEAAPLNPIGPATGVVPLGAAAGTYTLTYLSVGDAAGNVTTYLQGSASSTPAGSPALLDLAAVKVTVVQPATADVTAPLLTSFAMVSPTVDRRLGEFATWSFSAADEASPITKVRVFAKDPNGLVVNASRGGGVLTSGKISLWLPAGVALGHWTVEGVRVTDSAGNSRDYTPDGVGAQSGQPSDLSGPTFVGMGFDVTSDPVRPDDVRVFDEYPDAVVSLAASSRLVAPGTPVAVSGTVTYVGHVVPFPSVAVYADTSAGRVLLGVVRGTASGAFTRRVVPSTTTTYRVVFLGSDRGGASAPATLSGRTVVSTAIPQRLDVASRTVSVRALHRGTLLVTLSPRRAGARVYLQRRVGTTCRAVTSGRTNSRGQLAISVPRPTTAVVYRWVTLYDGRGLPATSAAVTVRRG